MPVELEPAQLDRDIDRAVDAFLDFRDECKALRQEDGSNVRATNAQWKQYMVQGPTNVKQKYLHDTTANPTIFDNDLTVWFVEWMRAERAEVAQILQTRHSKLIAEWSRIVTRAKPTRLGDSMPAVPITPRVNTPTAPSNNTIKNHELVETGSFTGGVWSAEPSPRQEVVGHHFLSTNVCVSPRAYDSVGGSNTADVVNAIQRHGLRKSLANRSEEEMFEQISWKDSDPYFNLRAIDRLVSSAKFELGFGALMILSSLVMAVEIQYEGFQTGYEEQFPHCNEPAAQRWPGIGRALSIIQTIFGICFVLEVFLKLIGRRTDFPKSIWNWFDAFVALSWILYESEAITLANPASLRLFRIARLFRMVRLARTFATFDMLQLIVGSVQASVMVLVWSLVYIFFLTMTAAMLMNAILADYISGDDNNERYKVYLYFGTFTRSMVTMWEITLGNWVPVGRLLIDNVSEWFALCFLVWNGVVSFAMITTIRGVFLHETFKAAQADEDLMIIQKQRMLQKTKCDMMAFFAKADVSGDGLVSRQEFLKIAEDPRMKAWIAAMDIDVTDVDQVFTMMDDGDGYLSVDELLSGISRVRGSARSLDLCHLAYKVSRIEDCVIRIHTLVNGQHPDLGPRKLPSISTDTSAHVCCESHEDKHVHEPEWL